MAISTTPVQQAVGGWSSGTTFTVTLGAAPTNGNYLILVYGGATATVSIVSISQTGVTWQATADKSQTTGRRIEIWRGLVGASAGTVVTVTISTSTTGINAANVSEWSSSLGLTLDATNSGTASSATVDAGSITPTSGRSTLMIFGGRTGGAIGAGPTGGFTALTSSDGGSRNVGAYLVTTSSGSYDPTWAAATGTWGAAIASYVEPAPATTNSGFFRLM